MIGYDITAADAFPKPTNLIQLKNVKMNALTIKQLVNILKFIHLLF